MVEESSNLREVPIRALRMKTRCKLCCLLNGTKVLPSPSGIPRDWRGLAHLSGIEALSLGFSGVNKIEKILTILEQKDDATLKQLCDYLAQMDRFDALDDTESMMIEDANFYFKTEESGFIDAVTIQKTDETQLLTVDDVWRHQRGLEPQMYDAFVLFVDSDVHFATNLIETLEKNYSLKLCVRDRDLVGGINFEHEAVMRLISDRCNRLIVILSSDFFRSDAHKFFVNFAQAIGIEQRRRKVIPCIYQKCILPPELRPYFLLDFNRMNSLWNFWDKLRDSIVCVTSPSPITASPVMHTILDHLESQDEEYGITKTESPTSTEEWEATNKESSEPLLSTCNVKKIHSNNKSVSSVLSKITERKSLTRIFRIKKKADKCQPCSQ